MHKHRRHPSTTSNKSKFSAGRAYTYTFLACLVVTIAERSIHYQSVSQGHQYRSYHMTCRPFERMCIKPMDQFPKGMILLFQCSLPNRPNIFGSIGSFDSYLHITRAQPLYLSVCANRLYITKVIQIFGFLFLVVRKSRSQSQLAERSTSSRKPPRTRFHFS